MNATHAYWKRREDIALDKSTMPYLGGWGSAGGVPSYGEVKHLAIPTAIETTTDANGVMTVTSPPIIGPSKAYRYRMYLSPQALEDMAHKDSSYPFSLQMSVISTESPHKGSDRENWWWYARDSFSHNYRDQKTPVRLMTTWKRGMLEILLAKHPEKDRILAEWDASVSNHKAYNARNRAAKKPNTRKAHNDLVVYPHAVTFTSEDSHQIFRYHIEQPSFGGRAKHSLRISGTRFTIPHGDAMTFHDGTAPIEGLSAPIKAAMALLAWARAPMLTNHHIVKAKAHFPALADATFGDLESWLDTADMAKNPTQIQATLDATLSAIRHFIHWWDDEVPAATLAMRADITAREHAMRARILPTLQRCQAIVAAQKAKSTEDA